MHLNCFSAECTCLHVFPGHNRAQNKASGPRRCNKAGMAPLMLFLAPAQPTASRCHELGALTNSFADTFLSFFLSFFLSSFLGLTSFSLLLALFSHSHSPPPSLTLFFFSRIGVCKSVSHFRKYVVFLSPAVVVAAREVSASVPGRDVRVAFEPRLALTHIDGSSLLICYV